jgi:predicted nuclease of restriction endonuclease-like (RecB) superfamily
LIVIDDPIKRDFYIEIARLENWSVRQLQERIKSMLFERTAISKKPEETIQHDLKSLQQKGQISLDLAFRDPYLLDFLGLSDKYSAQAILEAKLHQSIENARKRLLVYEENT